MDKSGTSPITDAHSRPYASPGLRFAAHLIDSVVAFASFYGGALAGALVASSLSGAQNTAMGFLFGWVFWGAAASFLNLVALQGLTGASIGKHVCGIRVVSRATGEPLGISGSALRTTGYFLSALPMYFGYLSLLWDKQTRCWHDMLCGSVVVRKDAVYPPRDLSNGDPTSGSSDSSGDGEDRFPMAA